MMGKRPRVIVMVAMVLIFSLTVVFAGCEPVDVDEITQEPLPDFDLNDKDIDLPNELKGMNLRTEFVPEEGIEAQEIRVLNDEDEVMFQLTIDELNQWTEENWDIFEEVPEVGGRRVDPTAFGFFDRVSPISHDNRKMIFSVSDYAVATTVSFLIVVNIKSGKMNMIDEPAPGKVEDYFWSETNHLIAYTIGTARGGGDFLLVDDVIDSFRTCKVMVFGDSP